MVRAAEAATARGQVAALGFTYRRVPALALAKQFVEDGKLGTVRQAKVAYLQDWLVDAEAPMSWRLRKETAGSGALGDIASHAIDQVQHLTGQRTTAVRGRLATMVPQRPGEDGPEAVNVDDAAWATVELYGAAGALRFDLDNTDELWFLVATRPIAEQGFTRVLVTEPEHPYLEAWWPQGHVLGWENAFSNQARDLLLGIAEDPVSGPPAARFSPDFSDGLALQRVLDAIIASDAADGATVAL